MMTRLLNNVIRHIFYTFPSPLQTEIAIAVMFSRRDIWIYIYHYGMVAVMFWGIVEK